MDQDTPKKVAQAFQAGRDARTSCRVMLNNELPFHYPPALYARKVQGNVTLRLYIDRNGPGRRQTRRAIEESSGYPALDSAAVKGSQELRFVPAKTARRAARRLDPVSRLFPPSRSARRFPATRSCNECSQPPPENDELVHHVGRPRPAPLARNPKPYESVLETIGWTPLIRLNAVTRGIRTPVYGKAEFFNPGGSVKDRIGLPIIEQAEREGRLKPGGTIVEGTSGNTGVGLAIAAALKGYKCIFTMPDKMSQEKVRLLKAFGAEVIITPTAVPPDHPDNYVMMAKRIAEETPNAILADQFYNQANPEAHYATTGPELWEQTEGRITHFVAAAGTGGTITGVGRYLKEQNPKIQIIAGDPHGLDPRRAMAEQGRTQIRRARRTRSRGSGRTRFPARST